MCVCVFVCVCVWLLLLLLLVVVHGSVALGLARSVPVTLGHAFWSKSCSVSRSVMWPRLNLSVTIRLTGTSQCACVCVFEGGGRPTGARTCTCGRLDSRQSGTCITKFASRHRVLCLCTRHESRFSAYSLFPSSMITVADCTCTAQHVRTGTHTYVRVMAYRDRVLWSRLC